MNTTTKFWTSALAAAAVTSAMSLAHVAPANALSLTFKPTGTSLDGDSIKDLAVNLGDTIKFDIFLETFGLADDDKLGEVEYKVSWDSGLELGLSSFSATAGFTGIIPTAATSTSLTFKQTGAAIAPDSFSVPIASYLFNVKALQNDGLADFDLTFLSAADTLGNAFTSVSGTQNQNVEVQAVPTPALLPGVIGMGLALLRKRREELENAA